MHIMTIASSIFGHADDIFTYARISFNLSRLIWLHIRYAVRCCIWCVFCTFIINDGIVALHEHVLNAQSLKGPQLREAFTVSIL